MKLHLVGLAMGLCFGVFDCALFAMAGPVQLVDIASALTVWTMIGWAIHASYDLPSIPNVLKGVLLSWAFNIPWGLEFVVAHEMPDLLLPMIAISTLFGIAMGAISHKLKRQNRTEYQHA